MREIRTSGLTSGDGKRGVAAWPKPPRPSSTLQVKGRKRQVMVDTDGRGLILQPQPADVQDRDGAVAVLRLSRRAFPLRRFRHDPHAPHRTLSLTSRTDSKVAGRATANRDEHWRYQRRGAQLCEQARCWRLRRWRSSMRATLTGS